MPIRDVTPDQPDPRPEREPSTPVNPRSPIGSTFGGYEVQGELGRGGMGVVYRALQTTLNRQVALKMLTGHFGQHELHRFLAEAQTAAALHHTNIVHIYEVGEIEGAPFFSMEFVEGGTLGEFLKKGLPEPRKAADLLATVARALHFAHQNGIVHRDMKPANVLLDADGVPKVADFGIAKRRLEEEAVLTISGAIIGTPTYMAPEQAGGMSRDVGPAADVYALGAILYEMLTGRPPFLPDESETALTLRVMSEEPVSPAWHSSEVPRELETICMKCLEKEPRDRYTSAAAVAEDLRRYLDDEPILAKPPTRLVRGIKWVRRNPGRAVLSVIVAAAVAFGIHRWFQWEFYQRLRTEHAAVMDFRHGAVEPVLPVSDEQRAARAVTMRYTRQGRWGPIIKVEAVNSRGFLAAGRRIFRSDHLSNWIEGVTGAQDFLDRNRETTAFELAHNGSDVREMLGRDRNGNVNFRVLFERASEDESARHLGRARFTNLRGFDFSSRGGASHAEFERDANGRDRQIKFFNSTGQPAPNGEGVYGYAFERNAPGRVIKLTNLGRDGQPAPNRLNQISFACEWGPWGITRMAIQPGPAGETPASAVAATTTEFDAAGNISKISRWAASGELHQGGPEDWSFQEITHNAHGQVTELTFHRRGEGSAPVLISRTAISYDERGYPAEIRYAADIQWRTAFLNDERGNILEERFLDAAGQPKKGPEGYAVARHSYHFSPSGLRMEDTYFNADGTKAMSKAGHHRTINEFDPMGVLRRFITEDHDPARYRYFRYVSEPEFDQQSRLKRSTTRFQDEQGNPAVNAGLSYTINEIVYDDEGRAVDEWQHGWSEKEYGASLWHIETSWRSGTNMKRRISQACGPNRQPLAKTSNGYPARVEEEFDELGGIERFFESGFDVGRCGFLSRETLIVARKIESIIYRDPEGNEVKGIHAVVVGFLPDAQPAAAQFRPGDQLLNANGEEFGPATMWATQFSVPPEWIEVLRDGQRVRLTGFQSGKVGLILEDRAPGVSASAPPK